MLTQRERKVATVGAVAAVEIENMFIVCKNETFASFFYARFSSGLYVLVLSLSSDE